ncbi:MAG: hypothetical protein J6332_03830, partial [Abditibacteriota bacterium]|nr:hypothetical protein [Abditibacteriota bacterium]
MKKLLFICVIVAFAAASWAKPLPTPDELFKGAAEPAKTTRDMPHTWKAEQKADYDFFPISFWRAPYEITDEKFAEIAECGFNVAFVYTTLNQDKVLDLCQKYGMKAQLWLPDMLKYGGEDPELESHLGAIVDKYKDHPALWGYHLCDEPNPSEFAKIAEVRQFIKQRDPKHLSFVNLFPTYLNAFGTADFGYCDEDRYVDEFCKMVKPEILSYDSYPFMKDGTDRTTYFSNLEIYRKYALKHDVPMNSIILSIPHTYAFEDKWGYRDPTEAEMRWEVYTSLAYGAKGILYFTYDVPKDKSFDWGDALLNYDGSRNEKWYYAQQLNKEIKALGPTLLNLTSCAVYHTGDLPNMTKALPADNFLQVSGGDFVIGQFYDKSGDMYAMVTNRDYKNKVRAKMTFAKPVAVKEVAPHSGTALQTSPTEFVKDLKPGDGCLIKIDAFGPVVGWSNYVKPRPRVVLDPS